MGRPCICCIKGSSGSSGSSSSGSGSGSSSASVSSSSDSGSRPTIPDCCADCISISIATSATPEAVEWTSPIQSPGCFNYFDPDDVGCGPPCSPPFEGVGYIRATCQQIFSIDQIPAGDTEGREKFVACSEAGLKTERWTVFAGANCIDCATDSTGGAGPGGTIYANGRVDFNVCCGDTISGCVDLYVFDPRPNPTKTFHCTLCFTITKYPLPDGEGSSSDGCPCVSRECPDGGFGHIPLQYYSDTQYGQEPPKNINKIRDMLGPGPGTELHKIIPKFLASEGCGCKDMAKKMNFWGPDGCDTQREHIVDYLVKKGKDVKLFGWVPKKMIREVSDRMLTMAIERARSKETENWFVAVTTAPRRVPTVNTCLESLVLAGFSPYVFAEPNTNGLDVEAYGARLIQNEERKGVWHNWIHSARYAIENSDAEIIMTVQDDSLFHPDSKIFTESILWPAKDVGFVSLYTPKHYSFQPKNKQEERAPGVNRIYTKSLWGACALVWPRKVLEEVLQHDTTYTWLGVPTRTKSIWQKKKQERKNNPALIQNSDTAIGKIMNQMKRSMYFLDPSPVNHFAQHSAINHGGNRGRRNCHRCAHFEIPLQRQIPLMNNEQELFKISYQDIEI
jgi:hypothetical protein